MGYGLARPSSGPMLPFGDLRLTASKPEPPLHRPSFTSHRRAPASKPPALRCTERGKFDRALKVTPFPQSRKHWTPEDVLAYRREISERQRNTQPRWQRKLMTGKQFRGLQLRLRACKEVQGSRTGSAWGRRLKESAVLRTSIDNATRLNLPERQAKIKD